MRFTIVVGYLGQILASNIHIVGKIVVAGGDDKLARMMDAGGVRSIDGVNAEVTISTFDAVDAMVLAYVEGVMIGHLAVVLQRFTSIRLLIGTAERNIADLKKFGRCKERHVCRIVKQRI